MGRPWDMSRATVKYLREYLTVEPIMFALSMTNYMRGPTGILLVLHKVCQQSYNDTVCADMEAFPEQENEIHAAAAYWNFYLKMALFIPWSVSSAMYGPLSDRLGRRVFLIVPSIGYIVASAAFLCEALFPGLPLDYLLVTEMMLGLSGNAYIVAKSYLCDVTEPTSRTKRLGVMKAVTHVGGPVGGLLAGALVERQGFTTVYSIIAGIHFSLIVYVLLWLDETVDYHSDQGEDMDSDEEEEEEDETQFCSESAIESEGEQETKRKDGAGEKEEKKLRGKPEKEQPGATCDFVRRPLIETWKSFRMMVIVCVRKRQGSARMYILIAMLFGIIHNACSVAEGDLIVLYSQHSPLNWSPVTVGAFISLRTALKAVTLAIGLPIIFRIVKNRSMEFDLALTSAGVLSTSVCLLMIAVSETTALIFTAAVVGMLVSFPSVAITSVKSKLVEPHEYGAIFSATNLVQTLTAVAGSGFFSMMYAVLLPFWSGGVFFILVVLYAISLVLILYIWRDMHTNPDSSETTHGETGGPKYKKLENVDEEKQINGGTVRDSSED